MISTNINTNYPMIVEYRFIHIKQLFKININDVTSKVKSDMKP